jgi:hypothetical protein
VIPHVPESIEAARERFPSALAEVVDIESVMLGNEVIPGKLRKHIFDFADGLRLIVSREAIPRWGVYLHVSASFDEHSENFAKVRTGQIGIQEFFHMALDRYHAISGDPSQLEFDHLSSRGIPHWKRPERGG